MPHQIITIPKDWGIHPTLVITDLGIQGYYLRVKLEGQSGVYRVDMIDWLIDFNGMSTYLRLFSI